MIKQVILLAILAISFSCNDVEINSIKNRTPTVNTQEPKIVKSEKDYFLGEIQVKLIQYKGGEVNYGCKSKIIVIKNKHIFDSISFIPEALGGMYGVSKATKYYKHLLFTKHGDYDGRSIIINDKGTISNILGGQNQIDTLSKILFSIYESDLSGFAIYSLKTDSIIFMKEEFDERPLEFHRISENVYLMNCSNDETNEQSYWKINLELKNIIQIDTNSYTIDSLKKLFSIPIEDVNCICK